MAAQYSLPLRVPFPPESDFAASIGTLSFLEGFPRDLVRGMIATNSALLSARGLAHPDHFIGTFFGQESLTVEHLANLIEALPSGVCELMCHPGYHDAFLASSTYRCERETELALLTDPALLELVEVLGIELVTFKALQVES